MTLETHDKRTEPHTDEFEKLEFLPEQPAPEALPDDAAGAELSFSPEPAPSVEPPVSFIPDAAPQPAEDVAFGFLDTPAADLDLDAGTPYELFGSSLFDDGDLEDDDLDDDLNF